MREKGKTTWLSSSGMSLVAVMIVVTFMSSCGNGTFEVTADSTGVTGTTRDTASKILLGRDHTCALISDGTVKCWGNNFYGQLGNDSTDDSTTPVIVSGLSNVRQVILYWEHTCAIINDGTVKCWGKNENSQLGASTTQTCGTANIPCSSTPVEVSGLSNVSQIASGAYHYCALLTTGSVKCWGLNSSGQLGDGNGGNTGDKSPTPVLVSGITNASRIALGHYYSCALLTTGSVKCWGRNSFRQLGDGTSEQRTVPVAVSGITNASQIRAGEDSTCVILSDASVKCWGTSSYGKLGYGSTDHTAIPVTVSGIDNASQILMSNVHACALLTTGSVKCWGKNESGQLGNGSGGSSGDKSLAPVEVFGITNASQIDIGYYHFCALLSTGFVKCWGLNSSGQLGDGNGGNTGDKSLVPVTVSELSNVSQLSLGGHYSCVVLNDDTVKCWGQNSDGQLGDGSTDDRTTPINLVNLS